LSHYFYSGTPIGLFAQLSQSTAPGLGHCFGLNVRRQARLTGNSSVHEERLVTSRRDKLSDVPVFFAFGVKRSDE
jgi:hypothetical protein